MDNQIYRRRLDGYSMGILNKVKEIDPSSANYQILVDKFGTTNVDTISKDIYEILWNDLKGKTFRMTETKGKDIS